MTTNNDAGLLALSRELDALIEAEDAYYAHGVAAPDTEAAAEERLRAWSDRVYGAIIEARATPAGRALKRRAMEHFNALGELTPDDRIAEAGSHSEALAWAMVRDLMAERAGAP